METHLRFLNPAFILVHTTLSDDASTSAPLFIWRSVAPHLQERMAN